MALTRKFLLAMSIDDDKIEQIISAHTDTVTGLKEEIDKYKADALKLPDVQKKLNKAQDKIAQFEAEDHESPYKQKYDELQKEKDKLQKDFDDYKADVDAKAVLAKKSSAYRQLLKDAGVSEKRYDAIMRVTALDGVELDDEGKIKDPDKLKESIKKEWADFIVTENERGVDTPNPPKGKNDTRGGESLAAQLASRYHRNMYGAPKEE